MDLLPKMEVPVLYTLILFILDIFKYIIFR